MQQDERDVLQSIFDRVATHLLTQNERSTAVGRCAYRGDNDLKCAIGVLIKDEFYDPVIEGRSVKAIRYFDENKPPHDGYASYSRERALYQALELSGIPVKNESVVNLLLDLQSMHDNNIVLSWPPQLSSVAKKFGLVFTEKPTD